MRLAVPTAEHGMLECMAGEWKGEEVILPSRSHPEGGRASGLVRNRLSLGGFVLLHEYRHERDGWEHFTGYGVITWNRAEECYVMHWFDSSGFPPAFFKGTIKDGVMVLETEREHTRVRLSWDFRRGSRYESRVWTSQDGSGWQPFAEAIYHRRDRKESGAGTLSEMEQLGIVANVLRRHSSAIW